MVSRITNPETSRSSGSRVLASHAPAPVEQGPKTEKKDPKILQNEAKKSFRINKTDPKKAQNEAI